MELSARLGRATALADAVRVRQVVDNLLSNAAKFTPAGGRVTVTTFVRGQAAVLEVTDTGCGIDPDELDLVFQRFYRGRGAQRTPGSGIGLAVVGELVAAHGGSVELRPREGGGTTVRVVLPRAEPGGARSAG